MAMKKYALISVTTGDELIHPQTKVIDVGVGEEARERLEKEKERRAHEREKWLTEAASWLPWWAKASVIASETVEEVR